MSITHIDRDKRFSKENIALIILEMTKHAWSAEKIQRMIGLKERNTLPSQSTAFIESYSRGLYSASISLPVVRMVRHVDYTDVHDTLDYKLYNRYRKYKERMRGDRNSHLQFSL